MPALSITRRLLAVVFLLQNNRMGGYGFVAQDPARNTPSAASTRSLFAFPDNSNPNTPTVAEATSTSTSSVLTLSPSLSPLEAWCVTHMEVLYSRSLSIKCPFFKRRSADLLDGLDMMMRFLVIRHKSLDLIGPPPGCRSTTSNKIWQQGGQTQTQVNQFQKRLHTTWEERLAILRHDWRPLSHKGYYITGRLNTTLYRDDCFFDGPDPDMPVKGLRKYLNAASNLFDHATSTAELLSMELVQENESTKSKSNTDAETVIVAYWRLQGVLHLPWHPQLPVWTGRTKYHFDEQGLVYHHSEEWDISVAQAFMETLWPDVASRIWTKQDHEEQAAEATTRLR
jgi:hypothetical protein